MSLEERPSSYQLQQLADDLSPEIDPHSALPPLPPADGGKAAWLFLLGSFMIEMVLWGFPFSFGVLNDYYTNHKPTSTNPHGISAVGTTCSGIMYLAAPLLFAAFQRWPLIPRRCSPFGLALMIIGLALSSYATTVWHLILTQGVLYAIGGCFVYYPIFLFIDEWFVLRKGFAYGIMWGGSGCGGLSGPLVINWGLARYGHETFLRGWAIALLVLIGPFLFFVKPRLPASRINQSPRFGFAAGFAFVKTGTFWALQFGNIFQGLGYFIPSLYLPGYARTLGFTPLTGSLTVSLLNTASVPGVVLLSALCDRLNVTQVVLISTLGSALSVFLLWGFSTSLPTLITFALLYGFFAGGFTSTYAGTVKELRRVSVTSDLGSIFGLLSAGRGIGNVICGPISEAILGGKGWDGQALFAYGSAYGPLIVFTGITATLALTPWITKRLHLI